MYNSLTLVPAYGRDYKSKAAVMKDWTDGKDFVAMISSRASTYVNIQQLDLLSQDYTHLHFRYNKQTLVHVVKL